MRALFLSCAMLLCTSFALAQNAQDLALQQAELNKLNKKLLNGADD